MATPLLLDIHQERIPSNRAVLQAHFSVTKDSTGFAVEIRHPPAESQHWKKRGFIRAWPHRARAIRSSLKLPEHTVGQAVINV